MDFFIQLIIFSLIVFILLAIPKFFSKSKNKQLIIKRNLNLQEKIVLISGLTILVIGIISIYFYAERNERSILILNLGVIMIMLQQFVLGIIRRKKVKPD